MTSETLHDTRNRHSMQAVVTKKHCFDDETSVIATAHH